MNDTTHEALGEGLSDLDPVVAQAEAAQPEFDYDDRAGNKLARSHVHKLRQLKGRIERARVDAKAKALQYGQRVDAKANDLKGKVQILIEPHESAIREVELREARRIEALTLRLNELAVMSVVDDLDSPQIAARLTQLDSIDVSPEGRWEEFRERAAEAKYQSAQALAWALNEAKRREAEAAELEALRKEKAARDAADALERTKREAAEMQARMEADAKKKAEEEAAWALQEQQRQHEAEKAALAEEAEAARQRAEDRIAQAEADRLAEAQALDRKAQEEREAAEARARNNAHRVEVMGSAVTALSRTANIPLDDATNVINAIVAGQIPHVTITF